MNIFTIIEPKFLINSPVSQIPFAFIAYKVISKLSTTFWNYAEKWILISKAYLAVRCGR